MSTPLYYPDKTYYNYNRFYLKTNNDFITILNYVKNSDYTEKYEVLNSLCEILDYTPTKEITFKAIIEVEGRAEVELGQDDIQFILEQFEFDVQCNNYNVIIENDSLSDIGEY